MCKSSRPFCLLLLYTNSMTHFNPIGQIGGNVICITKAFAYGEIVHLGYWEPLYLVKKGIKTFGLVAQAFTAGRSLYTPSSLCPNNNNRPTLNDRAIVINVNISEILEIDVTIKVFCLAIASCCGWGAKIRSGCGHRLECRRAYNWSQCWNFAFPRRASSYKSGGPR